MSSAVNCQVQAKIRRTSGWLDHHLSMGTDPIDKEFCSVNVKVAGRLLLKYQGYKAL